MMMLTDDHRPRPPDEDLTGFTEYTSAEVAQLAGCTYRQLDYWCRTFGVHHDRDPGSGHPRRWTRAEVRAACALGDLSRHGIQPRPWAETLIAVLRRHPHTTHILLTPRFDSPLPFTDAAEAARWVMGTTEPVTQITISVVPDEPPEVDPTQVGR